MFDRYWSSFGKQDEQTDCADAKTEKFSGFFNIRFSGWHLSEEVFGRSKVEQINGRIGQGAHPESKA